MLHCFFWGSNTLQLDYLNKRLDLSENKQHYEGSLNRICSEGYFNSARSLLNQDEALNMTPEALPYVLFKSKHNHLSEGINMQNHAGFIIKQEVWFSSC